MSYNGRMSMARTTQHNQRAPPVNEHDAFMTLPDHEIAGCISDIGIQFPSQIYRSRIPKSSRRSSNGSPSYS
ncbi:unnamed protein product [Alternaria alternata]